MLLSRCVLSLCIKRPIDPLFLFGAPPIPWKSSKKAEFPGKFPDHSTEYPRNSGRRIRALSVQQKSAVQIVGIFAGRMERVRPLPRIRGHVLCNTGHEVLGETLLCLKLMVDFLKTFAALEQHDCETISCTILYSNKNVILVAAIAFFMRRELTRVNGYVEVTIPGHLSGEFENHFRMPWETCQLLTQEIMHTGWIPTGNLSERPAILLDK